MTLMGNCTLLLENMTRSFSSKECPTFPFFSPDGSLHSVSIQTLPGYLSILSLFHRVVYLSTRRISSSLLACSAQSLPFALLKLNTDYNSMREEEGENGLARKECPSFPFFSPLSWTDPCVEYTRQIDSPMDTFPVPQSSTFHESPRGGGSLLEQAYVKL